MRLKDLNDHVQEKLKEYYVALLAKLDPNYELYTVEANYKE
jgi:hypothetical protein